MTDRSRSRPPLGTAPPIAWVVPGPLRQVTGGYLYDARIVDGLRTGGWAVGVIDVRSTRWPFDLPAGRRLISALGRQRWGAVVVDELAHPALVAALLAGRLRHARCGTPLVLLVHHLRCSEPAASRPQQTVARLVERLAVRTADLILCTSNTTAQIVRALAHPTIPVRVVRPGWDTHTPLPFSNPPLTDYHADAPTLLPLSAPERGSGGEVALPRGEVAPPGLRLLLVGHWTPRKGILTALDALAAAPHSVTLDLVGEQDRDPAYAAQVWRRLAYPSLSERVCVHGRVSDQELGALYAAADALLLTSTYEGYGMVLAEALAAGLPIIASRVGAVPEVVSDGDEAALVPAGDVPALTQAIARLAADPAERRRCGQLARARARTLPSWSDSVASFEGHLRTLLARTSAGG